MKAKNLLLIVLLTSFLNGSLSVNTYVEEVILVQDVENYTVKDIVLVEEIVAVEQPHIVCGTETFETGASWYQLVSEENMAGALQLPTTTISGISPGARPEQYGNTQKTIVLVADDFGNPTHPGIEDCPEISGAVWTLHIVQTVNP